MLNFELSDSNGQEAVLSTGDGTGPTIHYSKSRPTNAFSFAWFGRNGIQKITNEDADEDRGELPVHRCIRDAHLADGSIT